MKPLVFPCQFQSLFSPPKYGNYSPVPTGNQLHTETPTCFTGGVRGLPIELLQDAAADALTFSERAVSLTHNTQLF